MSAKLSLEYFNKIQTILPTLKPSKLKVIDKFLSTKIKFDEPDIDLPSDSEHDTDLPDTITNVTDTSDTSSKNSKVHKPRKSKKEQTPVNTLFDVETEKEIQETVKKFKKLKVNEITVNDLHEIKNIGKKINEMIDLDNFKLDDNEDLKQVYVKRYEDIIQKLESDLLNTQKEIETRFEELKAQEKATYYQHDPRMDFVKWKVEKLQEMGQMKRDIISNRQKLLTINEKIFGLTEEMSRDYTAKVVSNIRVLNSKTPEEISEYIKCDDKRLKELMIEAMKYYPDSWIDDMNTHGGILTVQHCNRGFYRGGFKNHEVISANKNKDQNGIISTFIHELGHRIAHNNTKVAKLESLFYQERTKGCKVEKLGYPFDADEFARRDDFIHPYMGKFYPDDTYEVISMGMQYFFCEPDVLKSDEDMYNFIAGLVAII